MNKVLQDKLLNMSLAELELSVRATNCLESEGLTKARDLVVRTEDELLEFRNFGETLLKEVKQKLRKRGLSLLVDKTILERRLSMPVMNLGLSLRPRRALHRLNIKTVRQLVMLDEQQLLALRNFGQTSLREVEDRLWELGLSLGLTPIMAASKEPAPQSSSAEPTIASGSQPAHREK
jgi:DNA-directed RNA polymerase alpha subunit